jgi:hypothetical protein
MRPQQLLSIQVLSGGLPAHTVCAVSCRIEVGTETGVDRSKSVMSYLVQHFQEQGNITLQVRHIGKGPFGRAPAESPVAVASACASAVMNNRVAAFI